MGLFYLGGGNYAVGYRYRSTFCSAFRITQSMSTKRAFFLNERLYYNYDHFQSIKLGYQYRLGKNPLHALIFTDLLFINTQHGDGMSNYDYPTTNTIQRTENISKKSGFGAGGGISIEWFVKKRIALLLTGDLYTHYGTTKSNSIIETFTYTTYSESQTSGFDTMRDLTLSVSYRFR